MKKRTHLTALKHCGLKPIENGAARDNATIEHFFLRDHTQKNNNRRTGTIKIGRMELRKKKLETRNCKTRNRENAEKWKKTRNTTIGKLQKCHAMSVQADIYTRKKKRTTKAPPSIETKEERSENSMEWSRVKKISSEKPSENPKNLSSVLFCSNFTPVLYKSIYNLHLFWILSYLEGRDGAVCLNNNFCSSKNFCEIKSHTRL